jgi:hypothetical protein
MGDEAAVGTQFIFLILLLLKDTKVQESNSDCEISQYLSRCIITQPEIHRAASLAS